MGILMKKFFIASLILGCVGMPYAHASLVYRLNPTQMTQLAKEVRKGEVVSTWTSPDPVNKMIYTYVKIRVEETFKGVPRSEVLLRQPGGSYTYADTKTTYRQKVFGMETFQKGEKGIFFIEYAKDGAPSVMFEGKHQILKDPQTGSEIAHQPFSRAVHYVNKELKSMHVEHATFSKNQVRNLQELVQEIQSAVQNEKGGNTQQKQ